MFGTVGPFDLLANVLGIEAVGRARVLMPRGLIVDRVEGRGKSKQPTGSFGNTQDKRRRRRNLRFRELEIPEN